ncbi:four helix bundle protein [Capnocytophaga haemolytica]|nr:four helix bundle protein [Capnocytophaga haemolytica]
MEVKSYKDLTVWQKAIDLAESIYRITALFPNEERFGLINQMRRCAVSISSNDVRSLSLPILLKAKNATLLMITYTFCIWQEVRYLS